MQESQMGKGIGGGTAAEWLGEEGHPGELSEKKHIEQRPKWSEGVSHGTWDSVYPRSVGCEPDVLVEW
jgi:hypothetical protein